MNRAIHLWGEGGAGRHCEHFEVTPLLAVAKYQICIMNDECSAVVDIYVFIQYYTVKSLADNLIVHIGIFCFISHKSDFFNFFYF